MIIKIGPRHFEKLQLSNSFIARELAGTNEEVKQPQRERVADFFASYRGPFRPRCFCLPGARWAFENMLDDRFRRDVEFVGVERNYTIMETALREMPGSHQMRDEFETKKRTFRGFSTNRAKVAWCNASELMGVQASRHHFGKKRRATWLKTYKLWSHAWLDFSSPINDEVMTCCKRLEGHLDFDVKFVPVAVTFMLGREEKLVYDWMTAITPDGSPLSKRATFLRALWEGNRWRTVHPINAWRYLSAGGAPMGVATFLFELKPDARSQPGREAA